MARSAKKLASLAAAAVTITAPTMMALEQGTAHAAVTYWKIGKFDYSLVNCSGAYLQGEIMNNDNWASGGSVWINRGSCNVNDRFPLKYKVKYKSSGHTMIKEGQSGPGPLMNQPAYFGVTGTIVDSCFGDAVHGYWAGITPKRAAGEVHTGCFF